MTSYQRVFGPVPSRRLGRSLGINNIPPKVCTYSCVYCQLGSTINMTDQRREFFDPEDLAGEVKQKIEELAKNKEIIDYLTIVPDGEPTLDTNLGKLLRYLKPLGIKTAVISNASLIYLPQVRKDLMEADWVSLKIDALENNIWRKVDRPHGKISLEQIKEGLRDFARVYDGTLVSETMLVQNFNDSTENIRKIADFLGSIKPGKAYLGIPTRPPAEAYVSPPTEGRLNQAFQLFVERGLDVEYLIGYEGNEFSSTGDVETDLLSITSVHPMREDAVTALLARTEADFSIIEGLIDNGKLSASDYQGKRYYIRRFTKN